MSDNNSASQEALARIASGTDTQVVEAMSDLALEIGELQKERDASVQKTKDLNKSISSKQQDLQKIVLLHTGRGEDLPLFDDDRKEKAGAEVHDGKAAAAGK